MASHQHRLQKKNPAGAFFFFMATLVMWGVSVFFELLFHKRTDLYPLLAGFCFYQFANWICRNFISRDPLLVNTCVSLLHSSLTSASVVFILVKQLMSNGWDESFEHSQLVNGSWAWAYSALCVSCGYFAYDQLDMLLYGLYNGKAWIPSILLHHFVLLGCFTLALYQNVTINYLILTLICELHSVFLHVRKVRRMAGFRDGRFVKIEWFLNGVTFFLARLLSHLLITIKLLKDASKFEKGVELPLALLGMFAMNLLNIFLGIDILNAFRREIKKPK